MSSGNGYQRCFPCCTGERLALDELLALPCDVLIPAAIPDVITEEVCQLFVPPDGDVNMALFCALDVRFLTVMLVVFGIWFPSLCANMRTRNTPVCNRLLCSLQVGL